MKVVVQRSLSSKVEVEGKVTGKIEKGLVLLVGFSKEDTEKDVDYLVEKIVRLRIFDDENGVMNLSILDTKGSILSISQFTLYASCKKGNRPSYVKAMPSDEAKELYELFNQKLRKYCKVETGIFQADMKVSILNDGPVTILLESRKL